MAERYDDVDLYIARVNVHHEIGEDPVVKRTLITFELGEDTAGGVLGADRTGRGMLRGIITEEIDTIIVVIHFLEEAGMRDRNMIAFQIIIDVHFPVAIDHVITAL